MRRQGGFTYLGVLFAVAILGVGLTAASEVWVTTARHQRMEQLDWVGQQYVQAIGSYYEASPSFEKKYPPTLADLLEDKRFAFMRRHIRQLYVNPYTDQADWELVTTTDGRLRGVRAKLRMDVPMSAREYTYQPGRQ